MQKTKNNKYIVFPLLMILLTLLFTFMGYLHEWIFETLKQYDVTGLTTAFMYIMLTLELAMLGFCLYKGIKGKAEGFDYLFSKFACIIFGFFIIVPIISYFAVICAEENTANELKQKEDDLLNQVIYTDKKSKTTDKLQEYIFMHQDDEFYERKLQIIAENKDDSKIERFAKEFVINRYNYSVFNNHYWSESARYYATFSRFSVINILCLLFYFASWNKDRKLNRARNNK